MPEPAGFPSTHWSLIAAGGQGTPEALNHLARTYWRPVARTIAGRAYRLAGPTAAAESEDLAQEFFVWLQQSDFLAGADRDRGRFRAFLQTALRRFLIDQQRRAQAVKRGGGRQQEPLTAETPDVAANDPAELLDREWRRELVATALADVKAQLQREGKPQYYELFDAYFVREDRSTDYAALAQRFGVKPSDVSNQLALTKKRYRSALRARITETVRDPAALQEELAWFFGPAPKERSP
ncbi:MAG: ECF-type sigma factor [Planctomycetota bacterium]